MGNSFGIAHRAPGTDFRARAEEKQEVSLKGLHLRGDKIKSYLYPEKYNSAATIKPNYYTWVTIMCRLIPVLFSPHFTLFPKETIVT